MTKYVGKISLLRSKRLQKNLGRYFTPQSVQENRDI